MVNIIAEAEKNIQASSKKIALQFISWAAALYLMITPFMRGLFYTEEFIKAQIVLGIILVIYGLVRIFIKKEKISFNNLDILALLFFLSYAVSLFTAVHIKEAIIGVFEVLNYIIVYFLVKDLTKEKKQRVFFSSAIFTATVLLSLVALMVAVGALDIHISSEYGDKRIVSLLQHANAYGIYAVLGIMLGLGLLNKTNNLILRIFISLGIVYNFIGMLGSQSRGSWLVLGFVLILWLLLSGKEYFRTNIYPLLSLLIVIFIAGKGYLDGYFAKNFAQSIRWLIIGTVLTAVIIFLVDWLTRKLENNRTLDRYKAVIPWVIGINLIIICGFYFIYTAKYLPSPTAQILSKELIHRADTIGGDTSSFQGRLAMYNWAWAMIKDGFIFGRGADGWHALYHQYQDVIYWAKHVHSHFLQIWIEAGLFGFLSFTLFWLALIYQVIRSLLIRLDDEEWPFAWCIFLGLLAMLIHSVVDYDLSLPALSITVWALGALVINETEFKYERRQYKIPKMIVPVASILIGVLLLVPASREYKAMAYCDEGAEAWYMRYYPMAIVKYEKALELSPLSSDITAKLSQLYAKRYDLLGRESYKEKAVYYAQKTQELSPYNVRNYVRLNNTYSLVKDEDLLINNTEMLAYVVPTSVQIQESLAQKYYERGIKYLQEDNIPLAKLYLEKTSETVKTVEKNYLEADKAWTMRPTANLFLLGGKSASLLGDKDTALERLTYALRDGKTKEEAGQWLAFTYSDYDEVNFKRFYRDYVEKKSNGEKKYRNIQELHKHMNRGSV